MKKLLMFLPLVPLAFVAFTGCGTDVEDDIANIKNLLLNSYFTGEGSDGVTDDGTDVVGTAGAWSLMTPLPGDTGTQLWVRRITEFHREVVITEDDVSGDSAFATITNHLIGTLYVLEVDTAGDTTLYERDINDTTYREVVLKRGGGKLFGGWAIDKLTPCEIWTIDPTTPVKIASIKVTSTSGESFEITDPTHFYDRDEIPRFTPEDTVTVDVELSTDVDAWAYLHHGRHFRLKFRHHRKVFTRDDADHNKFTGTWVTAEDSLFNRDITVRHAAIDVILAETLEGDSTAEYSAYAIGFPYLIAKEGTELPEDGADDNQ